MSQLSLGIIEAIGLSTAIQVADICVKSANVNLIGYEFTKGSGMTVVKIEGNVGAVKAAVDAALASTDKIAFSKIIARPNKEIEILIRNDETVGFNEEKKEQENSSLETKGEEVEEIKVVEKVKLDVEENLNKEDETLELEDVKKKLVDEKNGQFNIKEKKYTCNICKDPKCTRHKGELISTCIHHKKINAGG
ncbi:MAG: BMC domain-containing protein [Tissierella sp.]|nr:BMC domain-containing protein [Tissierella sp.]